MFVQSQVALPSGIHADAAALRRALDRDAVTARAALEACLAVVDSRGEEVNAVVYEARDAARAEADACDRAVEPRGVLHGVPVTIKESFDWAGHPTTWGDPARAGRLASEDSGVVASLKLAGAVIFGKTNVPAYLSDWETANPLFGPTRNPHEPTRSAGGSSGGSAAAVSSGMSYIDIGTDQGGSIRYPAHNCGVHGLKPSWGAIPLRGHSAMGERRTPDMAVAGPLARSAADMALAFDVLGKASGSQPEVALRDIRFAQLPVQAGCTIDDEYQAVIMGFSDRLRQAGARVELAQPEIDFDRATEVMNLLVRAETSRVAELIADFRQRQGRPRPAANSFAKLNARGASLSHKEWLGLHEERLSLCEEVSRFFASFDVLLCPAAAGPAPPLRPDVEPSSRTVPVNGIEEPILKQHLLHMPGSLLYLPAYVLPCGTFSNGLPAGIQMLAAHGRDRFLLLVASEIERSETASKETVSP